MAKKKTSNKQVEQTLDLVREHLLDMIAHPEKLDQIPNNATVVLIPVPIRSKKAA
jgi:hypothetical protein